jgi:acyl-CoA thioester hydrolase
LAYEPTTFVHRLPFRVGYIDTDRAAVVHHSVYLRWLEHGRIEFFRERGLEYKALELDDSLGLPVVECRMKYKLPARFDDEIVIETRIGRMSRATVRFDSSVLLKDGPLLVAAEITLACVRLPEGGLRSLPESVKKVCGAP